MSRFDEDKAQSSVNGYSLDKEFGITNTPYNDIVDSSLKLVEEMREQLPALTNQIEPDTILYKNINRANKILDKIEEEICEKGALNARLVEVFSQLINAVTSATASIAGNSFAQQKHEYNMRMVEVKEQEVEVKKIIATNKVSPRNHREEEENKEEKKVIVMDRESILKMMEKDKPEVHIEPYQPIHRKD